jgi:sensor c-di-GMP phosphodiesterase-like protein
VVAEGVENTTQMNLLRSLQCRMMQGYLISRPMPGADLPAWVAEHVAVPSATAAAEPLALSQAGESHPAASR